MATFTTISKNKLSWKSTGSSNVSGTEEVYLSIDDTHLLDIGGGYNLIITPENAPTSWETVSKTKNIWVAPDTSITDYTLLIDDTHTLDIGNGYELIVNPSRPETIWSSISRNKTKF